MIWLLDLGYQSGSKIKKRSLNRTLMSRCFNGISMFDVLGFNGA